MPTATLIAGGFVFSHRCGDRDLRQVLPLAPTTLWRVETADPLTITPSILCPVCRVHGWIRDGEWVPAAPAAVDPAAPPAVPM
ncbi:DUF6527 family protein [Prescottella equi]|uniref:DUF6527 family protein n=1 Tax=Rhodococcus hoagii TaxID=43767 RepID=UPI0007CD8F86